MGQDFRKIKNKPDQVRKIITFINKKLTTFSVPTSTELATFVIHDLGLNTTSFGYNELAGFALLKSLQYRVMNIILCVIHGIPLKRNNKPGKNFEW